MKRILCALLAVCLLLAVAPVRAASVYASVDGKEYDNWEKAWKAATNGSGHQLVLIRDWSIDDYLEVPENCKLTVELNGYMINRGETDSANMTSAGDSGGDGSVFYVKRGANLTVQSSDGETRAHKGKLISGIWYPSGSDEIKGGLITGGATDSDSGGAFTLEENSSLTLKNLTVAGCVCDEFTKINGNGGAILVDKDRVTLTIEGCTLCNNFADGDGGAIYVDGESCKIRIEDSEIRGNRTSHDGGAIYINDTCADLFIRNTKIMGNTASGDGGAVYVNGTSCQLVLDASVMEGNTAHDDGGAIFADESKFSLYLQNGSMIAKNLADGDGGGICYANFTTVDRALTMTGESAFRENEAKGDGGALYIGGEELTVAGGLFENNRAGKRGGAMFFYNDDCVVKGAELIGNSAGSDGGAIYLLETECTLESLTISRNTAKACGGGIYIANDDNIIKACTIKENQAGSGGGIFTEDDTENLYLEGLMTVQDNLNQKGAQNNLMLGAETVLSSIPLANSTVYITAGHRALTEEPGCYDERGLYSDDPNYQVYWDTDRNSSDYRHLVLGKGERADVRTVILAPEDVTGMRDTGKTYSVQNAENTAFNGEYPLYTGYSRQEETEDLETYFYSDGYFLSDAHTYDRHLATMSMHLVMSAFMAVNYRDSSEKLLGYTNKFCHAKQLLADIGCADEKTRISDSFTVQPTSDSIGYVISQKPLLLADGSDSGFVLIPVAVRGAGYESEWASNVTLGSDGEAAGFANAADQVLAGVQQYLEDYQLTELAESGKLRFWVVGYSRAGATANLTSKRLIDAYQGSGNVIYGYTFEAPQGGCETAEAAGKDYTTIHNSINQADFVPYVAPIDMGFKRYGVDHFVPGDAAGTVSSYIRPYAESLTGNSGSDMSGKNAKTKFYRDNEAWEVDSQAYNEQLSKMRQQLLCVSATTSFDDYFHLATLNPVSSAAGFIDDLTEETGNQSVTMAKWLPDFFHYVIYWIAGDNARSYYHTDSEKDGVNYEQAVRNAMVSLMTMTNEQMERVKARAPALLNDVGIWLWALMAGDEGDTVDEIYRSMLKSKVIAEDAVRIDQPTFRHLMEIVVKVAYTDFDTDADEYPDGTVMNYGTDESMVMLGTFLYNMGNIVSNHQPLINLAWLRSYDTYYTDDSELSNTYYAVSQAKKAAVKTPEVMVNGEICTTDTSIEENGTLHLQLAEENRGGAIYYTLKGSGFDETEKLWEADQALILPEGQTEAEYTVTAHTVWYDTVGDSTTIKITVKEPPATTVPAETTAETEASVSEKVTQGTDGSDSQAGSMFADRMNGVITVALVGGGGIAAGLFLLLKKKKKSQKEQETQKP